jgi:hypothetical protein
MRDMAPSEEKPDARPQMEESRPSAPDETEAAREVSPFAGASVPDKEEFPDWLSDFGEEEEPLPDEGAALPPDETIELTGGLARAQIPDWLAELKPSTGEGEKEVTAQEPEETRGLLKGLRGLIQPASVIEAPAGYGGLSWAEPSEAALTRAKLLQSLLSQPAERSKPSPQKQKVTFGELVQRWIVALVLLLVVAGTLLVSYLPFDIPTLTRPVVSPGTLKLHDFIQDTASAEGDVLVAFEYGPAEADELDLVARPILEHLLDQQAHLSIVSTQPEGMITAARLMDHIITSTEAYTDTQYTIEDYRSGGTIAASQFLAEVEPQPDLLLILTAQQMPLRRWIEQTGALHGAELPIVAGVSAALEPAASPYLDASAGQLSGAIHGLSGAAAYEEHRGSDGEAIQRLNTLAAGHIAIVALMIIGAIFYTLTGSRRREK